MTRSNGYTLIELMAVVMIIAILMSVALPYYRDYLVRSNRSDAYDKLTEIMYQMERYANRNRTYTTNLADLGYSTIDIGGGDTAVSTDAGHYLVTAATCVNGGSIRRCVNLSAAPAAGSDQTGDWSLSLNNRGLKTSSKGGVSYGEWTSKMP